MNNNLHQGKVILVTGGSKGIGAGIVQRLCSEGAIVIFTFLHSQSAAEFLVSDITSKGGSVEAIKSNQENEFDVINLVRTVAQKYKKIDVLVNNAGTYEGNLIHQTTTDQFDRLVNVNIKSIYVAIREAVTFMDPGSKIINIGSVLGARAQRADVALYAMSKFAVAGLTRGSAHDLAPLGITVNCIQPGAIDTDMNPAVSDFSESWRMITPLRRHGKPSEIASVVSFLASNDSSFMTGTCINVDGGCEA